MSSLRSCILSVLVLLAVSVVGRAAPDPLASDWGSTPQGAARLIAQPEADGTVRLGLQFRLIEGWKIYWRDPGSAGLPPEIDWTGSRNLEPGAWQWPVPDRFSFAGLETFGYEGEAMLGITAKRPDPATPAHVVAAVDFLTCRELCVPNHVDLAFDIPPGAVSGAWGAEFGALDAHLPSHGSTPGLAILSLDLGTQGVDGMVRVAYRADPALIRPDLLIAGGDGVGFEPPVSESRDGVTILTARAAGAAKAVAGLVGKPLSVTLVDRGASVTRAVEADLQAGALVAILPPSTGLPIPMLLLALLGGFILNFMPCVLPVLSMKLLALIGHAGRPAPQVRASFLASAAGIVTSFLALALMLIALKAAGLGIGWGIQFQEPLFLAGLSAIVTLFACNLMGWFEIPLPSWLADRVPGSDSSLAGNFLTGAFATILATPCSAPFLGTAVGFALTGGVLQILAIFLCLGIGLALPYLAVAAFPRIARLMPRPGMWMAHLRRFLGVLLAGTAIWLLTVLAVQSGMLAAGIDAALALGAGIVLLISARRGRPAPALAGVAGILLIGMLLPPTLLAGGQAVALEAGWVPFDRAAIDRDVAAGKTVLVDVTAEWCLTCKVNERLVLGDASVRTRLTAPGIVAMRADWTRPDPAIAAYLASFGRYGIPFYAVYGPRAPGGTALPEVLSAGLVLDAIKAASDPTLASIPAGR
jgi:suppressor for copper-sensitivity B